MVMEFVGFHQELNIQLKVLNHTTEEISLQCQDHNPVDIFQTLAASGSCLKKLSLNHVNITPTAHALPHANGKKRPFTQHRLSNGVKYGMTIMDECEIGRMKKEADMYKELFQPLRSLTHITILDGWGVFTEPVHYLPIMSDMMPLLETVEIGRKKAEQVADDLLVLTNEALSSLARLNHLKSLHLLGFGGKADVNDTTLFTKLDTAIDTIAKKGQLEEFVYTSSGVTFYGIISMAKYCKKLRIMDVKCRFAAPGLFALENNIHFVKLGNHSKNKAEYLPLSDLRPLTLNLENIAFEESRYDAYWVNQAYPEETTDEDQEDSDGGD